jgi:uncharacterized protein
VIVEKNKQRNSARMVAGYCWDWKSKKRPEGVGCGNPAVWFRDALEPHKDGSSGLLRQIQ